MGFVFKVPLLSFHLNVLAQLFRSLYDIIVSIFRYIAHILYPTRNVFYSNFRPINAPPVFGFNLLGLFQWFRSLIPFIPLQFPFA